MPITLKAARVNAGLTQSQAIEAFNEKNRSSLAKATLISWESYKTFPTTQQFKALCSIYGLTMNDIFVPDKLT